jgi:hypothetical protein
MPKEKFTIPSLFPYPSESISSSSSKLFCFFSLLMIFSNGTVRAAATSRSHPDRSMQQSVLVNCGPADYLAVTMAYAPHMQLRHQNSCLPPSFIDKGIQPIYNIGSTDPLHCIETSDFIYQPNPKDKGPCSILTYSSYINNAQAIAEANRLGYPVVTTSNSNNLQGALLADISSTFSRLRRYSYTEIIQIIQQQMIAPKPDLMTYAGLFVGGAINVDSRGISGPGPASHWESRSAPFVIDLIYASWRHGIITIGAPNESELYTWTSYAPGMLALPMSRRKIYDATKSPAFEPIAARQNPIFEQGAAGNSFIAPQVAGFAIQLHQAHPFLNGYEKKALIYFFSISHTQNDTPDGPKRGGNAGIRFFGRAQQKDFVAFIDNQAKHVKTTSLFAMFCYERYEEAGFDNTIYDRWLALYSKIPFEKLFRYYEQWSTSKSLSRDRNYYAQIEQYYKSEL